MSLPVKMDENMPRSFATALEAGGLDVCTVAEENLRGAADHAVASAAGQEGRVLVTLDIDFANIIRWPPGSHPGIIVLRPRSQDPAALSALAEPTMRVLLDAQNAGAIVVVDHHQRVRIRRGEGAD